MEHLNCLNCDTQLSGKFCSNCGQKADTHRITFKHFIMHDVLHGVWHFEKGMLFTAKQALLRPGKAALDYIAGKRIRYYNVFYFILLLIGLNIFINHYFEQILESYNTHTTENKGIAKSLEIFMENYKKVVTFAMVPLFAFNSWLLFRRKKLNFSEHTIVAGIIFLGILLINTFSSIINFSTFSDSLQTVSSINSFIAPLLLITYMIFGYYTTFISVYSKFGFSLRIFLFMILFFIELFTAIVLLIGFLSNWDFPSLTYHT